MLRGTKHRFRAFVETGKITGINMCATPLKYRLISDQIKHFTRLSPRVYRIIYPIVWSQEGRERNKSRCKTAAVVKPPLLGIWNYGTTDTTVAAVARINLAVLFRGGGYTCKIQVGPILKRKQINRIPRAWRVHGWKRHLNLARNATG